MHYPMSVKALYIVSDVEVRFRPLCILYLEISMRVYHTLHIRCVRLHIIIHCRCAVIAWFTGFFLKFFALHFMFSFNPLICAIDVLIFFSNLVSLYPTFHIYYIIEFAQVMSLRHTWNCYLLFRYLMYTPLLLKHHWSRIVFGWSKRGMLVYNAL